MDTTILIIVISLIFSAFFSAIEIAFISANRLHLTIKKRRGGYISGLVSHFMHNPGYFISTTLIGNTVALVIYGIFMADLLEPIISLQLSPYFGKNSLGVMVLLTQTIFSTLLVLITAEFIPKSISLVNSDALLMGAALPMNLVYWLLFPLSWLVMKLSKLLIVNILQQEYTEIKPVFGLTDLNHYIEKSADASETQAHKINKEIFTNALEFKTIKVRDCMIPRKEIIAIDLKDDLQALKQKLIDSGHSKILVYENSIDNIVGYVHALEFFKKPQSIGQAINEVILVPETVPANELMIRFISERKSLAIIVDEYGGTSGLVTIEDIMEEIFGEIEDEYDDEDLLLNKLDNHTYRLSARHEVDFLNETYHFNIPEGDYDTLGGFIIFINKNDIPKEGDIIEAEPFKIIVESMVDARIDVVKLMISEKTD